MTKLERKGSRPGGEPEFDLRGVQGRCYDVRVLGWITDIFRLVWGFIFFFVRNTHSSVRQNQPVPELLALMPAAASGWAVKTNELYQFSGTLQTDYLAQRRYTRVPANDATDITLDVAYWPDGQAPVSLVASHTPDACLPGSGWATLPTPEPRMKLTLGQPLDSRRRVPSLPGG